jgi:hypothetical protein
VIVIFVPPPMSGDGSKPTRQDQEELAPAAILVRHRQHRIAGRMSESKGVAAFLGWIGECAGVDDVLWQRSPGGRVGDQRQAAQSSLRYI